MARIGAGLVAIALTAAPIPTIAQDLTRADREGALRQITDLIRKHYVFEDRREPAIAAVARASKAKRYDVASPQVFAQRISDDLRAATNDGHLYLRDNPTEYAAASTANSAEPDPLGAMRRTQAAAMNSGLSHLQILPGNVRYLRIDQFRWDPETSPKSYDDAAAFLKGGDAAIIDLRDNGGGSSDAADAFLRTLLPPDPLRPQASASRGRSAAWSGKPIYILVSAGTGSAAEAVAYAAKLEKTATVVGMATYGAANNTRYFPVAPRFVLSVSYHRPINPISGTNWEGVGVQPDLPARADQALEAAHAAALATLRDRPGTTADARAAYEWQLVADRAVLDPPQISGARKSAIAGDYGPIRIVLRDGQLFFYRTDRPKRPQGIAMRPLDDSGLFAVPGYIDLRLRTTATGIELMHGSAAATERFARTPG